MSARETKRCPSGQTEPDQSISVPTLNEIISQSD